MQAQSDLLRSNVLSVYGKYQREQEFMVLGCELKGIYLKSASAVYARIMKRQVYCRICKYEVSVSMYVRMYVRMWVQLG